MHAYYFHFRCIDLKYLLLSKFWWFIYNWDDNSLFVCLFFTFFGAGNSWATSKSRSRKSWIFALSVQNKLSRSQTWGRFSENRIKKAELFHSFTTWELGSICPILYDFIQRKRGVITIDYAFASLITWLPIYMYISMHNTIRFAYA